MRVIYKYRIGRENVNGVFDLNLPMGADFRHFGIDPKDGDLCAWFQVDAERVHRLQQFAIWGTGISLPNTNVLMFLGTCFDGPYVWHFHKVIH